MEFNLYKFAGDKSLAQISKESGVSECILSKWNSKLPEVFMRFYNVSRALDCDIEDLFTVDYYGINKCNIKEISKEKNISLTYIASYSNISEGCLYKWITKGSNVSYIPMYKLAKYFGCKIEDLFIINNIKRRDKKSCKHTLKTMDHLQN